MIFWKTLELRDQLAAGNVSEKKQMHYFIASSIAYVIGGTLGTEALHGTQYWVEIAALIFLTVIGIIMCFKANQSGDNREFLSRFICISWPISIRVFVAALVVFLIGGILSVLLFDENSNSVLNSDWLFIVFTVALEAVYFWRIFVHISYVAKNPE